MIPKEILKKVRRIEIVTRDAVNNIFSGEYKSVFKGQGMEFNEVREYTLGDDIRTIDWNVTARMGHPYVKKFMEERELTVMLLFDASSSGEFGTIKQLKKDVATEICALLAFSAIKNNDRVGLLIFTDRVEKYIPPRKGRSHVLRVIREILYFKPEHNKTKIDLALEYITRVLTRRSIIFLISDFLSSGFDKELNIANRKHDIIAITVMDRREIEMPSLGFVLFEDAETGEEFLVNTRDTLFREEFGKRGREEQEKLNSFFKRINVDRIDVYTDKPYVSELYKFFRMRARKLGL